MTKYNVKKSIAQKGSLMIEALAMLGLIAVVTPTMYKKSAERTMEVDDINTATTMRTFMNAAESYVAANYTVLIEELTDENPVKELAASDLETYLPYKFDVNNALYNFEAPKVRVVKNGINLTAFTLFPAAVDAEQGLGQERTARIASLIGASGGYVTGEHKARGIGGIWKLYDDDYTRVFGSDDSYTYSIVTASSDVVSDGTGEMDNRKYLSRIDEGNAWMNTMRTDLYMGGPDSDDPYKNANGNPSFSIRGVNRLLINTASLGENEAASPYGLYIAGNETVSDSHPSAYIGGFLQAGAAQFFAGVDRMAFSPNNDEDKTYKFEVNANGDMMNEGSLDLATVFSDNSHIRIGTYEKPGNEDGSSGDLAYVMEATPHARGVHLSLISDGMFEMYGDADNMAEGRLIMGRDAYKGIISGVDENDDKISTGLDMVKYNQEQIFPVQVGSNMKVEGLLAAGQLDTNKIRAANLSVGSENVDDEYQWLQVDKDGVRIEDVEHGGEANADGTESAKKTGNQLIVNKKQIAMRYGAATNTEITGNDDNLTTDHGTQLLLRERSNGENTDANQGEIFGTASSIILDAHGFNNAAGVQVGNEVTIRNDNMTAQMQDNELIINANDENNPDDYRVYVDGGHVDLVGANLKVSQIDEDDGHIVKVFSIRGNDEREARRTMDSANGFYDNQINDDNTSSGGKYDVAAYGNILIGGKETPIKDDFGETTGYIYDDYVSVGDYFNGDASVNIYQTRGSGVKQNNIILVDQSASMEEDSLELNGSGKAESGTIYIRKGMVEVKGDTSLNNIPEPAYSAGEGAGVVKASRFVANNAVDGDEYKFTQLLTDEEYENYNGTNKDNRYDTYMVNPAYTSVMHDIKLTTRGGARLSDILPDFITKGIYLVTNSYRDAIKDFSNMEGKIESNKLTVEFAASEDYMPSDSGDSMKDKWGSPFLGVITAPQCPPGYGRIVTLTPISFRMAQAGRLASNKEHDLSNTNHQNSYYIDDFYMTEDLQGKLADINNIPEYRKLNVRTDAGSEASVNLTGKVGEVDVNNSRFVINSVENLTTEVPFTHDDGTIGYTEAYVLSAPGEKALQPMTFQQSTWLKTQITPLYVGQKSSIGDDGKSGYVAGWASFMGFLYSDDDYGEIIENINGWSTKQNQYKGSLYWNVFPVLRNSLEAYATTYCYFDRSNIYGGYNIKDYDKYIDRNIDINNPAISYEKNAHEDYLKRLNDPALRYDEVW